MNIFVLDTDPVKSAQMMCDKHVVKMIVETAQMLSTVARSRGHEAPYRATHARHPCTIWAGESKANWDWLIEHGLGLCVEYTQRYGRVHKSQAAIEWCRDNAVGPPVGVQTPFRLAMPPEYKQTDPVESYRGYYLGEKSRIAKWRYSSPPDWWGHDLGAVHK